MVLMRRFRFLLACLLAFAVPLQGFAAASMLLCGTGHLPVKAASAAQGPHHGPAHAAPPEVNALAHPAHDHSAHDHSAHDHTAHDPAAHDHSAPDGMNPSAHAGMHPPTEGHADVHTDVHGGGTGSKCSVCASCCGALALAAAPHPALLAPAPQVLAAALAAPLAAWPSPVPDKPPRA